MNKGILVDVSEELEGIFYKRIRSLDKLIKNYKQWSHIMNKLIYFSAFILFSQFCVSNSWASGAGFKMFGDNVERSEENGAYTANITVGQSFEIIAKGWAYPRLRDPEAAKGSPMKAEAGTWMFDDKMFKLLKTQSDETQYKISLKATKLGQYRIRFVGVVLGYNKACEILVNISRSKEE